jgi:hypothetical protein
MSYLQPTHPIDYLILLLWIAQWVAVYQARVALREAIYEENPGKVSAAWVSRSSALQMARTYNVVVLCYVSIRVVYLIVNAL